MAESKTDVLIVMLMGIVILLMVTIVGLFLRMNQLQREVLAAVVPLRVEAIRRDSRGLEVGMQAPDFTLPDTAGQMVSLDDFSGQKVLLAFSSTHCPACFEIFPHLNAFSEGERDVQVVMISQGSVEENRQLVAKQGFGFPVLTWEDAMAWEDYQVPGTPFFYVINDEGMITNAGFAGMLEQREA